MFDYAIAVHDFDEVGLFVRDGPCFAANGADASGVFIRCFDPDGAAIQDGRLYTNDQLLKINGYALDHL